jgi:hypothetical protein
MKYTHSAVFGRLCRLPRARVLFVRKSWTLAGTFAERCRTRQDYMMRSCYTLQYTCLDQGKRICYSTQSFEPRSRSVGGSCPVLLWVLSMILQIINNPRFVFFYSTNSKSLVLFRLYPPTSFWWISVSGVVLTIDVLASEEYSEQTLPMDLNTAMLQFELAEHDATQSTGLKPFVELSFVDTLVLLTSKELKLR